MYRTFIIEAEQTNVFISTKYSFMIYILSRRIKYSDKILCEGSQRHTYIHTYVATVCAWSSRHYPYRHIHTVETGDQGYCFPHRVSDVICECFVFFFSQCYLPRYREILCCIIKQRNSGCRVPLTPNEKQVLLTFTVKYFLHLFKV